MKNKVSNLKNFNQLISKICKYDSSKGEFLLPVLNTKKKPLNLLKKIFDVTSSFLKSVNIVKLEDNMYVIVIKSCRESCLTKI